MKEQAISKINKVGKISTIVALICKILVILGLVISLIGAIICLALPESLVKVTSVENVTTEVDYGVLGIAVSEDELGMIDTSEGQWQVTTVQNGVVPGNLEITSSGESRIINDISITDGVVKVEEISGEVTLTLRDVAGLMFVAMVAMIMTLVTLFFVEALCKAFRDCTSPFEENVIKKMQNLAISFIPWTVISTVTESILTSVMSNSMEWNVSVDMGVVLAVLVVLILVYIFKYGAVLQQESDETL